MDKLTVDEWAKRILKWDAPDARERGIFMFMDDDGNWRGMTYKDGKLIQVRDVAPTDVLVRLITHDGAVED